MEDHSAVKICKEQIEEIKRYSRVSCKVLLVFLLNGMLYNKEICFYENCTTFADISIW